jgi:LuxR family maltose regulon positive regulatory protein
MNYGEGVAMTNHVSKEYRISETNHLIRRRLHTLFDSEIGNRAVTVCAGANCGKTRAVLDFLKQQKRAFIWVQFSERDNSAARLWENITDSIMRVNEALAEKYKKIGFPDTSEKLALIEKHRNNILGSRPHIFIFDDFHHLIEPSVLHFIARFINKLPPTLTLILICRNFPEIDIRTLKIKDLISEINEDDLNFTENEFATYLKQQGLSIDTQTIHEMHKDTGGWAFAVNLVVRSLKRVPKYTGFVKTTFKSNIFEIMEAENWSTLSERLKCFLLHLSLIDHISVELVDILADGDRELLAELKQQNAYIRYDNYGGAYIIHHIYLDFLKSKQGTLKCEEKYRTYKIAADWCNRNNFIIDALNYYEKVGDYESIVSVLWRLCEHTSHELLLTIMGIFERAPDEVFDCVDFFASMHLFTLVQLARVREFAELAPVYEKRFIALPDDSSFKNNTLSGIYFVWGYMNFLMNTKDNTHDFDKYFLKAAEHIAMSPLKSKRVLVAPIGAWGGAVGSAEAGAPQGFAETVSRSVENVSAFFGAAKGLDDLCHGELRFYQNDVRAAGSFFHKSLECAREGKQFEIAQRSLFYILRSSIVQGNLVKTKQAMKDLESFLEEEGYSRRFITYDIVLGWYNCITRRFDLIPDWLKTEFAPYGHAYFIENFGNQIKARYNFYKRNYLPLQAYINELKNRESVLYGRVEALAMEACMHYQMKNKPKAWIALKEAYETASPNNIIMPFIELGKDMRTVAMTALREADTDIPHSWLESIKNKSTTYAKNLSMLVNEHKLSEMALSKALSPREQDVLSDLYHGFSQVEIARNHSLSVNTVKMVTKSIYEKLHVHKISDLIRVAAEQRLV